MDTELEARATAHRLTRTMTRDIPFALAALRASTPADRMAEQILWLWDYYQTFEDQGDIMGDWTVDPVINETTGEREARVVCRLAAEVHLIDLKVNIHV